MALLLLGVGAAPVRAGLYSVDEPFLFDIEDGIVRPLQYSGVLNVLLQDLRDLPSPTSTLAPKIEARIQQRKQKGIDTLSPDELASYAADMIRLNRLQVINTLQPLARDPRRGGFLLYTHMAAAFAARGDYREAYEQQLAAVSYGEFPASFGKLVTAQLTWYKQLERRYYLPWLKARATSRKVRLEDEEVDPLFTGVGLADPKAPPLQFVADNGQYRAGELAVAERKKLPDDALAMVQQLALWHPNDTRLYWLLGELYNADGDIEAALQLFDFCVARGYSPTLLKEHRRIVQSAVEALRAAKMKELQDKLDQATAAGLAAEQTAREQRKRTQWIVACAVAGGLLLLYLQIREIVRRLRRRRT